MSRNWQDRQRRGGGDFSGYRTAILKFVEAQTESPKESFSDMEKQYFDRFRFRWPLSALSTFSVCARGLRKWLWVDSLILVRGFGRGISRKPLNYSIPI